MAQADRPTIALRMGKVLVHQGVALEVILETVALALFSFAEMQEAAVAEGQAVADLLAKCQIKLLLVVVVWVFLDRAALGLVDQEVLM